MSNKYVIVVIILIVCVSSFLFYWYEIRPSNIKSRCANETIEALSESDIRREPIDWQITYDLKYKTCLNKAGL